MADYLSQLVAKNLAPQENIQPRLRGRFEPSPDISVDFSPVEMAQTGVRQPVTSPVADSAIAASQVDRILAQVQPYQPAPQPYPVYPLEEAGPSEQEAPAPGRLHRVPEELTIRPYRGRLNPPPALPSSTADLPANRGEVPPPPQAVPATSPQPTVQANRPDTQPENLLPIKPERPPISANVRLAGPPETLREITIERRSEKTLNSTIKTAVELLQEEPAGSLPPTPRPVPQVTPPFAHELAAQDLRPISPPLPDLTSRSVRGGPAPTINVTIGRIEVRAMPPSPSPPRKPTPTPKIMSLDEYLNSRSNGRGR